MSSILSILRSLFRSGEIPLPSICAVAVKTPDTHGTTMKITDADFNWPGHIFDVVNDANVKEGNQVELKSFHADRTFQYTNGKWETTYTWNLAK